MSQTTTSNTGQQLFVNTDTSKIFIWENRFKPAVLTNPGGAPVSYPAGKVLGRISASGKVVPFTSGASDGSQYILGVLNQDVTVGAGADVNVFFCESGDVATEMLVLDGSDTLDTVVGGRRVRDKIGAETVGIRLVDGTELTNFDNS